MNRISLDSLKTHMIGGKISSKAIIGIVIGVLVVVALVLLYIFVLQDTLFLSEETTQQQVSDTVTYTAQGQQQSTSGQQQSQLQTAIAQQQVSDTVTYTADGQTQSAIAQQQIVDSPTPQIDDSPLEVSSSEPTDEEYIEACGAEYNSGYTRASFIDCESSRADLKDLVDAMVGIDSTVINCVNEEKGPTIYYCASG